jgi:hypothetical protein
VAAFEGEEQIQNGDRCHDQVSSISVRAYDVS